MSREGGEAGSGGRGGTSGAQPFTPQFYPVVGYQGPPHAWFPPHAATGVPAPWSPSWRPPVGYPAPTPPWSAQQTPSTTTIGSNTTGTTNPSDEYTVDTLRRIYKDDDGRVEIQRVKVQRRHPEAAPVSLTGPESMSVVPVGSLSLNERRPPPRKNRRKQEIHVTSVGHAGPYPWYPYMPYMPYPYPYPYYMAGCMWPPGAPSDSISTWSGNDASERVSSHQDSTVNSQRLESRVSHLSRDSLSSAFHRSSSPAAASQVTDIHSLAPSDSVSVRGRKRETSLERALLGPTPPPRTKSRASSSLGCKSDDAGKTHEWMLEMQRPLRTSSDVAVKAPGKGSQKNEPSDVIYKKIPPVRKRRKMKVDDMSDKSSMLDLKDLDDVSERQSAISDAAFDESRLSSELNYAFRKFERSVDAFKTELAANPSPLPSHTASPSVEICHSSGDVTPTEAHVPPLSDIRGLAEKAKEEETKSPKKHGRPRAISESVSSLPSLKAARVGSAPDVSLHPKLSDVSSSQHTASTENSTVTATSTPSYPSPPATAAASSIAQATPSSVKTQGKSKASSASQESPEVTTKAKGILEIPLKPAASEETAEASDATDLRSPENATLPCHPSSAVQSSQVLLPTATLTMTTQATSVETQPGISKVPTELEVPSTTGAAEVPKEKPAEISTTVTSVANAANRAEAGEANGRHSRGSSVTTFFSTRTVDDSRALDTDSTDIPLPTTDSATADENEESPASAGPEDDHPWVLQRPGEAPTLNTAGQDECRNAWRAEVSLWRARLVVSLCRGRGLDRQDWATFHLMVHHPLTLDLKLSLLHAPRLCAANSSIGPAVLRVALIQLAQYGETLLQPEAARQPGWRSIRQDSGHAWAPMKGAAEILQSLGYQERGNGTELRYRRRCSPEASVVARLALDLLVLAEEFRLFLTGTHPYPNNVSELFYPEPPATCVVPDLPQRPPSSEGSFVSAQSETVPVARPESEASSVTDEDTETLQTCALAVNSHEKLPGNRSASREDMTLKEDDTKKAPAESTSPEVKEIKAEATTQAVTGTGSGTPPTGSDVQQLPPPASDSASLNSDETSIPDLHSSTTSGECQRPSGSEISSGNETITPAATPTPELEVDSVPKASETNPVTPPNPAPEATTDNPEEHVYEEIDVIRAQVQTLRASSVPAESAPPPLPPKTKVSSGGEDDSGLSVTYPQMEWSSSSMPGSLRGGSTGARRKKRRAPMPPEFLPQDWKQSQETTKDDLELTAKPQESKEPDNARKAEYRRSLNPFYEEIDTVQEEVKKIENDELASHEDKPANSTVNENPFLDDVKPTGYIGKNPFYDDVEILKKSDEYKEMKTKQTFPAPPKEESTSATGILSEQQEQQSDPPVVRPKRKAPRPPPTPESLKKLPVPRTPDNLQDPASPRHTPTAPPPSAVSKVNGQGEDKPLAASGSQTHEGRKNEPTGNDKVAGGDDTDPSQEGCDQIKIHSSLPASPDFLRNNFEDGVEPVLEVKITLSKDTHGKTVTENSSVLLSPTDSYQEGETETTRNATPKQTRAVRASPTHPRAPPPPPPPHAAKSPPAAVFTENSIKSVKEESPLPIPPPKAPLSLLDEIPYMDANEVKEADDQRQSPNHGLHTGTEAAPLQFPVSSPRQPVLAAPTVDVDLPPDSPPPPPPCPPPESPPETPHTSPPETPHTSPPETPHTSPPETPHTSPPETPHVSPPETPHASPPATPPPSPKPSPRPSPKPSPLLSRYHPQDTLATTEKSPVDEKVDVTEKDVDKAPLVRPKTTHLSRSPQTPAQPPLHAPPVDASQQEVTLQPQEASSAVHGPVTKTYSVQSSASEERYEIPDTSRAAPPRPPVPTPPKTQQRQNNRKTSAPPAEYDRYEVPEVPKQPVEGTLRECGERVRVPEAEERYEIPEVVKEAPLKRGVNGAPCTVALGRTSSSRWGDMTAVFGPPKPPRRRRNNNHSPPPRPPKHPALMQDALSRAAPRPPSITSSVTSSSSGPPPASLKHSKKPPKRRSWPFLLCDCLYINCRTYEDSDK